MRPLLVVAVTVSLAVAGCAYDERSETGMNAQAGILPCPAFSPDEYARAGEYAHLLSQPGAAGLAARERARRLCLARLGWDAQSFFSSVFETF
jgi:hypothetical protein